MPHMWAGERQTVISGINKSGNHSGMSNVTGNIFVSTRAASTHCRRAILIIFDAASRINRAKILINRRYTPPIEWPTQCTLLAAKPLWKALTRASPTYFEMMDERTTAAGRFVNEYWPQSRNKILWSLRLMYALMTIWAVAVVKSSIQPANIRNIVVWNY